MMIVFFSSNLSQAGAMTHHLWPTEEVQSVVKYDFNLMFLDSLTNTLKLACCTRPTTICGPQATWACTILCVKSEPMLRSLRLSSSPKMHNTSVAAVCRDTTLVDTIKVLFKCDWASKIEYRGKFVKADIKNIVPDPLSFGYLLARRQGTYVLFIPLARLCKKNSSLLSLLERLSAEDVGRNNLGILHLGCPVLHTSEA